MREPLNRTGEAQHDGAALVQLRIPAEPEWVGVARLAAAGIASRLHFSIEDIEDLKLAVAEACTCCIQNGGSGDIRLACALTQDRIEIAVERSGSGQAPAKQSEEAELGGLGVFLIRALMDDVVYEADPVSGTKLKLTKLLGK
jgi:serine/threonine-protein kinase RsbW